VVNENPLLTVPLCLFHLMLHKLAILLILLMNKQKFIWKKKNQTHGITQLVC